MKSRRSWEDHRFEEVFKVVKSSREEINIRKSNIGDSDNTGDGGKIVGGAIRACGGIVARRTFLDGKSSYSLGFTLVL
ncbi:hypothetical protein Tco_1187001 [Tanacetum coccineum]